MDSLYLEHILEHNKHPHNKGVLNNATFSHRGHNPSCGDDITLYLHLEGDAITDVSFNGVGCAISTASASLLTDYIKGKTIEEIKKIHVDDMLDMLGVEVNDARMKCALLPLKTLEGLLKENQK